MRIHSTKRRLLEVVYLALGLLLSFFLIKTSPHFLEARTPYEIAILIHFLCGVFVLSAVGMIFEENSRIGGLLLASISIPLLYYFTFTGHTLIILIEGLLPGIVVGFLLTMYAIFKNRFDVLARTSRTFLTGSFIILIVYLSNGVIMQLTTVYTFITGFIIIGCIYYILPKTIRGIKAGDVFVFGPKRSGKTYFLLGFHGQAEFSNEVIISPHDETVLTIPELLKNVEEGNNISGTKREEMAMYSFNGKKMGISPVKLTLIDYGGEHISEINPKKYREVIESLKKKIEEKNFKIKNRFGSIEFLGWLKEEGRDIFEYMADNIVSAYLYKRLESAGKIIFLVDGKNIMNFQSTGRAELTVLFGYYGRIMEDMKKFGDKEYALVVTKTDMFKDIRDVPEDSKEAEEIEKEIYQLIREVKTFKEVERRASVPLYFYAVSVDATKQPVSGEDGGPHQIYPWRFGKIAKFSGF